MGHYQTHHMVLTPGGGSLQFINPSLKVDSQPRHHVSCWPQSVDETVDWKSKHIPIGGSKIATSLASSCQGSFVKFVSSWDSKGELVVGPKAAPSHAVSSLIIER